MVLPLGFRDRILQDSGISLAFKEAFQQSFQAEGFRDILPPFETEALAAWFAGCSERRIARATGIPEAMPGAKMEGC